MDSFYVHLQSDASWHHYSNNTRTNYRNHLASPINVDGNQYEVALCELSYTYNKPFIKEGTELYRILDEQGEVPKSRTVKYDTYDIKGANQRVTSQYVYKNVLEYAKFKNIHISYADSLINGDPTIDKGKEKVLMLQSSIDILSTKQLTSTKEIVDDLNQSLNNLHINAEYAEEKGENDTIKQDVNIRQNKPWMIVTQNILFYEKVHKHFQVGKEDGYHYDNIQNNYLYYTYASDEKIDIASGELLCNVSFFKAEVHLAKRQTGHNRIGKHVRHVCTSPKSVHSVEKLIDNLNLGCKDIKFELDKKICKLTVQLEKEGKVLISDRVQAILGLDVNPEKMFPANIPVPIRGKQLPIFDVGSRKIFVYTDFVQDQRVGDQMAPILRMTDYSGNQNELVIKTFDNPHYIKLSKDYIDNIRIYMKSEIGEELPLTFGTTSCTLHFREKRL